jgi:hypothetical protein
MRLEGLAGLKDSIEITGYFYSVSAGMRGLKKARARTAAAAYGAINIWVDDAGMYRGERFAFRVSKSTAKVKTSRELEIWLKEEFPKIGQNDA